MRDNPVITIDGPAASGKGTLARNLSVELGFHLLDSGLLYRIIAFTATNRCINLNDAEAVSSFVENQLVFRINEKPRFDRSSEVIEVYIFKHVGNEDNISIDDANVNLALRSAEIGQLTSIVAAYPEVRKQLIPIQRSCRKSPGLVADGRDMASVIFPDADVKIYLDASVEERARRRSLEFQQRGDSVDLEMLERVIRERDNRDRTRSVAPLVRTTDSIIIDSSDMTKETVFAKALDIVNRRLHT